MIRLPIMAVILAIGSVSLATSPGNAQSRDPALLAPGQSGRMLAPPRYSGSRPSYASGHRDVFKSYRSLTGARLSHPSVHIH
jgi:hypothetical protein